MSTGSVVLQSRTTHHMNCLTCGFATKTVSVLCPFVFTPISDFFHLPPLRWMNLRCCCCLSLVMMLLKWFNLAVSGLTSGRLHLHCCATAFSAPLVSANIFQKHQNGYSSISVTSANRSILRLKATISLLRFPAWQSPSPFNCFLGQQLVSHSLPFPLFSFSHSLSSSVHLSPCESLNVNQHWRRQRDGVVIFVQTQHALSHTGLHTPCYPVAPAVRLTEYVSLWYHLSRFSPVLSFLCVCLFSV